MSRKFHNKGFGCRGQSSLETIMIAAVVIAISAWLASYYFGDVEDQTTAVIILKTGLLKEFSNLEQKYVIVSSLEPTYDAGKLNFKVCTRPSGKIEF